MPAALAALLAAAAGVGAARAGAAVTLRRVEGPNDCGQASVAEGADAAAVERYDPRFAPGECAGLGYNISLGQTVVAVPGVGEVTVRDWARAPPPPPPPRERAALIALFRAANGTGWRRAKGWGTAANACGWEGLTCRGDGRVSTVLMPFNNLAGTIPAALGDLSAVTGLLLDDNALVGTLPPELGRMAALSFMSFWDNDRGVGPNLSGTIPAEYARLSNLTSLSLPQNHISGTIPPAVAALPSLSALYLKGNMLSGTVPPLSPSLQYLFLQGNALEGPLPAFDYSTLAANCDLSAQNGTGFACPLPAGAVEACHAACA